MPKTTRSNPHKNWTVEERGSFLEAIKLYGTSNIKAIQRVVKSKSKESIVNYINYFRNKAEKSAVRQYNTQFNIPRNSCPLDQWLNAFSEHFNNLKTVLPCAFKLIAYLEKHPSPEETGVDYKKLYLALAQFLEGHNNIDIDNSLKNVMSNSLVTLATECKLSKRADKVEFVQNITRLFPDSTKIPTQCQSDVEEYPQDLRELQSLFAYNPLAISLPLLKNDNK